MEPSPPRTLTTTCGTGRSSATPDPGAGARNFRGIGSVGSRLASCGEGAGGPQPAARLAQDPAIPPPKPDRLPVAPQTYPRLNRRRQLLTELSRRSPNGLRLQTLSGLWASVRGEAAPRLSTLLSLQAEWLSHLTLQLRGVYLVTREPSLFRACLLCGTCKSAPRSEA